MQSISATKDSAYNNLLMSHAGGRPKTNYDRMYELGQQRKALLSEQASDDEEIINEYAGRRTGHAPISMPARAGHVFISK